MARPRKSPSLWYAAWTTAWGPIGAVASEGGIRTVILPHYLADQIEALLSWHHPGASKDESPFGELIELSRAYFNARVVDFSPIRCDLPAETTFTGKVLRACRDIPYGQTASYGELARQIGRPDGARAVATAMSRNPIPLVVPCHRVIYADGRLGGFSAEGGTELKRRMLALETGASA